MALSHKNADNEYFVHTAVWPFSGTPKLLSDTQQENRRLTRENDELNQKNTNLTDKYNNLVKQYNDIKTNGNELQWLKINHYFLHQHIENMSDSEAHKKQIEEDKQKALEEVEKCRQNPQAIDSFDSAYLKTLVEDVQTYIHKPHHDNIDLALFTWTSWIKSTQAIPLL